MEAGNTKADTVALLDGAEGHYMGDGVWIVVQGSDKGPQSVALTKANLEALLAAC
jgi:hypothetical protein